MQNLYKHWENGFIVDKYHDIKPLEKRFRSELYFLKRVMKPGMCVLDVGCASGELYHGLKKKYKKIDYTGIDISRPLIDRAKQLAPSVKFICGDIFKNKSLLKRGKFDLVVATGVFQHEPKYKRLLSILFGCVKNGGHVLFDVKLFHTHHTLCDIRRSYGDHGDHRVYYIILNFQDVINLILKQSEDAVVAEFFGYYTGVNATVKLPPSVREKICSAHILLQKLGKQKKEEEWSFNLSLPKDFFKNCF